MKKLLAALFISSLLVACVQSADDVTTETSSLKHAPNGPKDHKVSHASFPLCVFYTSWLGEPADSVPHTYVDGAQFFPVYHPVTEAVMTTRNDATGHLLQWGVCRSPQGGQFGGGIERCEFQWADGSPAGLCLPGN